MGKISRCEPTSSFNRGYLLARLQRKIDLISGAKEEGASFAQNEAPPFANAFHYEDVSFADYLAVLAREVFGPDRILYLRKRAWWAGNTRCRSDDKNPHPLPTPKRQTCMPFFPSWSSATNTNGS